jgi:hypothetical protein
VWQTLPLAPHIFATACALLRQGGSNPGIDIRDIVTRHGIAVEDPICGPGLPAPDLV